MDKFINVEEARAYAREHFPSPVKRRPIEEVLDNCPAVEIELVPHGQWIDGQPYTGSHWKVCSECHRSADDPAGGDEYCGHCGAKMNGGNENG